MALINNYYVFVKDEDVQRGVSISQHPVEKGLPLTDNVKRNPITINITGEIVGNNAAQVLSKITALHQNGQYVKYVGQNILSNAIIKNFDTSHPNTIYGGCSFTMEIVEIRIAKSALVKKASTQKKVIDKKYSIKPVYRKIKKHTVKKGDTLWAIAKKYYGSGAQYPKIVKANSKLIKNPNLIKVGWKLTIP